MIMSVVGLLALVLFGSVGWGYALGSAGELARLRFENRFAYEALDAHRRGRWELPDGPVTTAELRAAGIPWPTRAP